MDICIFSNFIGLSPMIICLFMCYIVLHSYWKCTVDCLCIQILVVHN